jgi:hypothetical protein
MADDGWHSPGGASETSQSHGRSKLREQLALIEAVSVPSFSSFKKRTSQIPLAIASSPVRRKPVQDKPSPRAVSFSYAPSLFQPHDAALPTRPSSIDHSYLQETALTDVNVPPRASAEQQSHQDPSSIPSKYVPHRWIGDSIYLNVACMADSLLKGYHQS